MAEIYVGDLDKTVTVAQVDQFLDVIVKQVVSDVEGLIEHWTDDDGFHRSPFIKQLARDMPVELNKTLAAFLETHKII